MSDEDGREKIFVLDTSVPASDPSSLGLGSFGEHLVVLPSVALSELDGLRKRDDEVGVNARTAVSMLREYRRQGLLGCGEGPLSKKISIRYKLADPSSLPAGFDVTANDEKIILTALALKDDGYRAVVVTRDGGLELKAFACGLEAEDYKHDRNLEKIEELYTGKAELIVDDPHIIHDLNSNKNSWIDAKSMLSEAQLDGLRPNQCCYIRCLAGTNGNKSALAIYKKASGKLRVVKKKQDFKSNEIHPVNAEQAFAYALLTDPDIKLVTLSGKAGTGKTLISLLAGYSQAKDYELSVYRPNIEIGDGLGFLPGDLDEKFAPWTYPILDNLQLIMFGRSRSEEERKDRRSFMRRIKDDIEISPISYIRGRSLHNNFVILDEAQNLTRHQVKTMLTRPGAGTKIVLTGDPSQIDSRFADAVSNGLTHAVEAFKDQEISGHITMVKGERSELAELAANLL